MTLNDQNLSNWRVIFTVQLHPESGVVNFGVKIVHSRSKGFQFRWLRIKGIKAHLFFSIRLSFYHLKLSLSKLFQMIQLCHLLPKMLQSYNMSHIHFCRKSYFLNNIVFTVTLLFTLILPKLIYLDHIIHLRIRLFTLLTLIIIL